MIDYSIARMNMVESQIRPNSVTDRRIIDAMGEVPREAYLPPSMRPLAYMDEDIELEDAAGQMRHLVQPMVFARLVHLADIGASDLVLDIGCGLGYSSAVLARLADSVVALECDEAFAARASETLGEQGADNAAVVTGPLAEGYADEAPYDAIVFDGSVPAVPQAILHQLKPGGRLVAVVSQGPLGRAHLFVRHGDVFADRVVFDATIPPLPGFAADEPAFVF
jgi:protein-L-isoaspartate(D-aspartate) O-methyltransferase